MKEELQKLAWKEANTYLLKMKPSWMNDEANIIDGAS